MKRLERVKIIRKILNEKYPNPEIPLAHNNVFTLLIAVILSAQSTDKKVNELTPDLFSIASSPESMARLGENNIYQMIKQLGLSRQKAKHINLTSKIIVNKFNGKVPSSFKDLESLPGVGHKTASVLMSQGFGVAAFPVDTHIHRLSQRWGLTSGLSVTQTEKDLKLLFRIEEWNRIHLQIIFYGREFCTSRGCDGRKCELCKVLFPKRKHPFIHIKA